MKATFLTVAVAVASLFVAHQAVAKSAKTNTVATKKHHKKHMKNKTASTVIPTADASVIS